MDDLLVSMGRVSIRPAAESDVPVIAVKMRLEHRAEVLASDNASPEQALMNSLRISCIAYTATIDGAPVAMFGVVESKVPGKGCVWLLCSDEVDQIKLTIFKLSRVVVANFHKRFPILFNWVDARYVRSLEWLDRLGALFAEPAPHGPFGMPFLYFEIGGQDDV